MRTKTLLLAAALTAAGIASIQAQSNVYSVNVVGYVNVVAPVGQFKMIANPLNATNNTIGGIGPVLPAGLAQIYKNEPALKMLQDDLRYYTYCAFSMLERNFDLGYYNELLNVIGECMYAASVEEMRSQQRILNKSVMKYMIQPSDLIAQVKSFVNSTMFLYVPMTREESAELTKSSIHRPDPDSRIVWNMSADIYTRHKRVLETSDPELEKLLASIPDQSVRDAVRARWKH